MHKLKKYPNRRLYDVTDSRYVTIDKVRELIARGESIEVIDSRDDSDITRSILMQILSEQEAQGHGTVLTNRVIEQMIRFYGDQLGKVASRYIEQSIVSFLDHQEQMRNHLRQLNNMNPIHMMQQAFKGVQTGQVPGKPSPSAEHADRDDNDPASIGG